MNCLESSPIICLSRTSHVCPVMPNSLSPYGLCNPPGFSVDGTFQAGIWSGLPFPPSQDLPDPEIEPTSAASPALAGEFFNTEPPGKPLSHLVSFIISILH